MEYGRKITDLIIGWLINRSDRNKIDRAVKVISKSDIHETYFIKQLSNEDKLLLKNLIIEDMKGGNQ